MKKLSRICIIGIFLFALAAFSGQTTYFENPKQEYVKAYTDFLLNHSRNEVDTFPISGYYLFDLNFDEIPELGVLHDSGGSMGGYFLLYCFKGNEIAAVLTEKNEPVRISNYTRILADFEHKNVYLLKEMYHLLGNTNGTYGYVSKINNQNGIPYISDILTLRVNEKVAYQKITSGNTYGKDYHCEDDYLLDEELDDCLLAKYYFDGKWDAISSVAYHKLKYQQIPEENTFTDLRNTDVFVISNEIFELINENEQYMNMELTEEEIDMLFKKWFAAYD